MPLTLQQRGSNSVQTVATTWVAGAFTSLPAPFAYITSDSQDDLNQRVAAALAIDPNVDLTPIVRAWFQDNFLDLIPLIPASAVTTLSQAVGGGAAVFAAMSRG